MIITTTIIKRRQREHRRPRQPRDLAQDRRLKSCDRSTRTFQTVDTDLREKNCVQCHWQRMKEFILRSYETSDGQTREESAYFREDETLGRILTVRGSYSYIGDEGKQYIVRYTADENGYRQEEGQPPPSNLPAHVVG